MVRWSVRQLTAQILADGVFSEVHYSTICLLLQEADLQPHRLLYWKLGHDPQFEQKALHVLWYYERALTLTARNEPVFCVDEKPGIQLLGRKHPDIPMRPGRPLRREHEYIRRGTGLLMMINGVADGRIFCRTPRRKHSAIFTRTLDSHLALLPHARRVHYILDNDPTHTSAHTRRWLDNKGGRVRFHHTPKYASWLNQAEIALSVFSRAYINNRVWDAPRDFAPHIRASTAHYNRHTAHPFDWSFTRNRFRDWYRSKTSSTGH